MRIYRQALTWLALFASLASAQAPSVPRYTILPPHSQANFLPVLLWDKGSYARWTPSDTEIQSLESNLSQIASLKIRFYESTPLRIEHPEEYFRQYIGVRHKGKRRIYVNAFREDSPPPDWQSRFYVVIDGGTSVWHAFYDPESGTFTDLTINPRA